MTIMADDPADETPSAGDAPTEEVEEWRSAIENLTNRISTLQADLTAAIKAKDSPDIQELRTTLAELRKELADLKAEKPKADPPSPPIPSPSSGDGDAPKDPPKDPPVKKSRADRIGWT